jgi:hypothetical protein
MEIDVILRDINTNLNNIYNVLWWISLWVGLRFMFSSNDRNVRINKESLEEETLRKIKESRYL